MRLSNPACYMRSAVLGRAAQPLPTITARQWPPHRSSTSSLDRRRANETAVLPFPKTVATQEDGSPDGRLRAARERPFCLRSSKPMPSETG